jgi:alpha/beta superfamily hydrolase
VLDIYGSKDWDVTVWGGPERKAQIEKNPKSAQVIVPDAKHFFEDREEQLAAEVVRFLDRAFRP